MTETSRDVIILPVSPDVQERSLPSLRADRSHWRMNVLRSKVALRIAQGGALAFAGIGVIGGLAGHADAAASFLVSGLYLAGMSLYLRGRRTEASTGLGQVNVEFIRRSFPIRF